LLLKDIENCGGRIARLKLGGKWMGEQILLCASFVRIQGIIDD
jgi:hypothetical protein